jgi:hypothetical protein
MKYIFLCLIIITISLTFLQPVYAAKKRVRVSQNTTASTSYSTAKLNRVSHSVDVYFNNLNLVSKISYELSYKANGIDQGAMGSINTSSSSDSRNLYFGTCSKGVCTPHQNITQAQLTIRTTLKNNTVNTKLYRIKF